MAGGVMWRGWILGPVPLGICAGFYVLIAAAYYSSGRKGMAGAFAAYALANAGFIYDLMTGGK